LVRIAKVALLLNFLNYNLQYNTENDRYFTRNFDYWVKRGIKGPKPLPIVGNIIPISKPLHELRKEWYQKFGKVYGQVLKSF